MAGTSAPDYAARGHHHPRRAARDDRPGLLAVAAPVGVGLVLGRPRPAAGLPDGRHHGGILLATVLNNGGGAWDNAKKFIESGQLKDPIGKALGKGTEAHAAAVVGDTVAASPIKHTCYEKSCDDIFHEVDLHPSKYKPGEESQHHGRGSWRHHPPRPVVGISVCGHGADARGGWVTKNKAPGGGARMS